MRTTIDIEDDLLQTVKRMAEQQKTTAGKVISSLLRESLQPQDIKWEYRHGVPVLPEGRHRPVVTSEFVKRLLNEEDD